MVFLPVSYGLWRYIPSLRIPDTGLFVRAPTPARGSADSPAPVAAKVPPEIFVTVALSWEEVVPVVRRAGVAAHARQVASQARGRGRHGRAIEAIDTELSGAVALHR